MPEIGDIKTGVEVGNTQRCKFRWTACLDCGKTRWVKVVNGNAQSPRCNICASKKASGHYPRKPLKERFWQKVLKTDGCWLWQGFCNKVSGYGQIQADGIPHFVHRLSYEWAYGVSLPLGHSLEIDHLCRNRLCVKPSHLELVTHRENTLRGIGITAKHAKATVCPQGHIYDLFNTYYRPGGGRDCKMCLKERDRRR